MASSDWLVRGTVWVAFAAWVLSELLQSRSSGRAGRWLWWLGASALAAHLASAMGFRFDWSHAAASADAARQTNEKFGINWGGGVWFNYVMVVWWLADAVWAAASPVAWAAPSWGSKARRFFFLFMWFNGAVVFPTGPVRWVGGILCGVVIAAWWQARARAPVRAPV